MHPVLKDISNPWPENVGEARRVQEALRKRLKIIPLRKPPSYIASLDAAFSGGGPFPLAGGVPSCVIILANLFKRGPFRC